MILLNVIQNALTSSLTFQSSHVTDCYQIMILAVITENIFVDFTSVTKLHDHSLLIFCFYFWLKYS